jgi:hypothetical protein
LSRQPKKKKGIYNTIIKTKRKPTKKANRNNNTTNCQEGNFSKKEKEIEKKLKRKRGKKGREINLHNDEIRVMR